MNVMQIQVLGSGCRTCKKLFDLVQEAAKELNLAVEVEYVTDVQKIVQMGLMASPVLVINGRAVLAGLVPGKEAIRQIIIKNIA